MKRTTSIIFFCFSFFASSISLSQIVINEIMYSPASPNKEWFELKNSGTSPVNLQNWKWRDAAAGNPIRTITAENVLLLPDSFAVICEDSIIFKNQYTGFSGIALQSSGWSALNNSGNENIVIYNDQNTTVDSLTYNNSWGGLSGFSLERKRSELPSNLSDNWGTSIHPAKATPGKRNSITPLMFDLMLYTFKSDPPFPVINGNLNFRLSVRNTGINNSNGFKIKLFLDQNSDSTGQNEEIICGQNVEQLTAGDSVIFECSYIPYDTGYKLFIAKVEYTDDLDTLNNKQYKNIFVSDNSGGTNAVVINEIMYEPLSGNSEWLEIFNGSGKPVNLKEWKYRETTFMSAVSDSDLVLNAGEYFVLAHDTTIFNRYPYLKEFLQSGKLKFIPGLSLSNSGETIIISDSSDNIIDAFAYSPELHNPNIPDTKGISLERISPSVNSGENSNWSSSASPDGGTPGRVNSIFTKNSERGSEVIISPNPFSPDGDGFEDFSIINYSLKENIAQIRIKIFDIKGRLVRTLINNSVSGKEGSFIFDGMDNNRQKLRIGIYILLLEAVYEKSGSSELLKAPLVIAAKL
ncbi:MAG: lamin tail domain-containing protein [Bacteroidetes bacterium]|nr:lamin tail domain-containing protein [Bacteroidota bacterium]